jgi:hypothetical protein
VGLGVINVVIGNNAAGKTYLHKHHLIHALRP